MTSHQLLTELFRIAKTRGVTHQLIADKTGKHRPHISRMANLHQDPSLQSFLDVCNAVGVKASDVCKAVEREDKLNK